MNPGMAMFRFGLPLGVPLGGVPFFGVPCGEVCVLPISRVGVVERGVIDRPSVIDFSPANICGGGVPASILCLLGDRAGMVGGGESEPGANGTYGRWEATCPIV
jgi:hypothetical protein